MLKSQLPSNSKGSTVKVGTVPSGAGGFARAFPFAVVLAGLVLRLVGLNGRQFWFDEVISAVYARQDLPTLLALNNGDNHPAGFYLALKGWLALFGTGEAAVRLLSVWPGIGS